MVTEEGLNVEVRSAGVSAVGGLPISEFSAEILRNKGAAETSMESNMLTSSWVEWADLILTMTTSHKRLLIQKYPKALNKTFTLKEYVQQDPEHVERIAQREQFVAELVLKKVTSQSITREEKRKLAAMDEQLPDMNIADPYGGTLELYQHSAEEIEENLQQLLRIVKKLAADSE